MISMWSCVWLLVDVGGEFLSYQHLLRTFRHPDLVNGPVLCIIVLNRRRHVNEAARRARRAGQHALRGRGLLDDPFWAGESLWTLGYMRVNSIGYALKIQDPHNVLC